MERTEESWTDWVVTVADLKAQEHVNSFPYEDKESYDSDTVMALARALYNAAFIDGVSSMYYGEV